MASNLKWHGPKVQRAIESRARRFLEAASIVVSRRAKELLSVSGVAHDGKGGHRTYGAFVSAPGEPPRKQTGHLRRSVAREVVGLVARVGTNLAYGRYLEIGTSKMAPRPWLRRALAESGPEIKAILAKMRL